MPSDPLEKFRKPRTAASADAAKPGAAPGDDDGGEYAAFKGADRQERLIIRRVNNATRRPSYVGLIDVVDDELFGTEVGLVFSFNMVVLIYGRNLYGLADAIGRNLIEWMQEYDASRWPKPKDESAAFIEKIEIIVQTPAAQGVSDMETIGKKARR